MAFHEGMTVRWVGRTRIVADFGKGTANLSNQKGEGNQLATLW